MGAIVVSSPFVSAKITSCSKRNGDGFVFMAPGSSSTKKAMRYDIYALLVS